MMWHSGAEVSGWFTVGAVLLAILVAINTAIVWTDRAIRRPETVALSDSPQHILDVRLARGDITAEEYRADLALLVGHQPAAS